MNTDPSPSRRNQLRILLAAAGLLIVVLVWVVIWQSRGPGNATSSDPKARENARQIMQQTMDDFVRDRDRAKAKRGFVASIAADRTYPDAHFNLAKLEEADENWDEALRQLRECEQLAAGAPLAVRAGEEIRQVEQLKERMRTSEGKRSVKYERLVADARNFCEAQRYGEALASAEEGIRLDGDRFEAYSVAAVAHARMKNYDEALKAMDAALTNVPSNQRATLETAIAVMKKEFLGERLAERASAAMSEQRYKDAASIYSQAWEQRPSFEGYGLRAALAYQLAGMENEAVKVLNKLAASKDLSVAQAASMQLMTIKALHAANSPSTDE